MYFDWHFDSERNDVVFLKESRETYYAVFFKPYSWHHHKCYRIRFTDVPAGKILSNMLTDVDVSMIDVKPSFLAGLKHMGAEDIEFSCAIANGIRKECRIDTSPYPVDISTHYVGFKVPYAIRRLSTTGEPAIVYITATDVEYGYGAVVLDDESHTGLKFMSYDSYDYDFKIRVRKKDKDLVPLLEERFQHYVLVYKDRECRKVKSLSDSIPGFGHLHFAGEKY